MRHRDRDLDLRRASALLAVVGALGAGLLLGGCGGGGSSSGGSTVGGEGNLGKEGAVGATEQRIEEAAEEASENLAEAGVSKQQIEEDEEEGKKIVEEAREAAEG